MYVHICIIMERALVQTALTLFCCKSIFFVVFYNKGYLNVQMARTPSFYIFGWSNKYEKKILICINALLVFPFNTKIEWELPQSEHESLLIACKASASFARLALLLGCALSAPYTCFFLFVANRTNLLKLEYFVSSSSRSCPCIPTINIEVNFTLEVIHSYARDNCDWNEISHNLKLPLVILLMSLIP